MLHRKLLVWLAVYAVLLAAIVAAMFAVRNRALASFDTPQARAEWDEWREAPPNQSDDLPVKRRPPSSQEPPALVLMRDYFNVMLAAAIVFGSLLFAALAIAARGALSGNSLSKQ